MILLFYFLLRYLEVGFTPVGVTVILVEGHDVFISLKLQRIYFVHYHSTTSNYKHVLMPNFVLTIKWDSYIRVY